MCVCSMIYRKMITTSYKIYSTTTTTTPIWWHFVRDYSGEPVPESKTNLHVDLLEQEIVSGSGISWAICTSAARPRQITMPAPHYSVSYTPDDIPAIQPTVSEHTVLVCIWNMQITNLSTRDALYKQLDSLLLSWETTAATKTTIKKC